MNHTAKYLYCVVQCADGRTFDDVTPIGDATAAIYAVAYDGLAAVVSDSPAPEYEATRANMLAHERVQERVLRDFTLLPIRFGTVASATPEQDIRRLLQRRQREFAGLLTEMEGLVELGLKALWRDERAVFEAIVAQSDDIRRLRDALANRPAAASQFDRMRLGRMVKAALDRKRDATAANILARPSRIARRVVENPTLADRVIVNAAFLVDQDRVAEFDRMVSAVAADWDDRVAFKYVGPVPPYNFVNIVVNWQDL